MFGRPRRARASEEVPGRGTAHGSLGRRSRALSVDTALAREAGSAEAGLVEVGSPSTRRARPRTEPEPGAPSEVRWGEASVPTRGGRVTMPLAVGACGAPLCLGCYKPLLTPPVGFEPSFFSRPHLSLPGRSRRSPVVGVSVQPRDVQRREDVLTRRGSGRRPNAGLAVQQKRVEQVRRRSRRVKTAQKTSAEIQTRRRKKRRLC